MSPLLLSDTEIFSGGWGDLYEYISPDKDICITDGNGKAKGEQCVVPGSEE